MDRFTQLRWLVPVWIGVLAFILSSSSSINAQQCNLQYNAAAAGGPYSIANPPLITLNLNATSGTVDLNTSVIVSSFFFIVDCNSNGMGTVTFDDGDPMTPTFTSQTLDCDDIGTTVTYMISFSNPPSTTSVQLPVKVKVVDVTAPRVTCPASVTVSASATCQATGIAGIDLTYVLPAAYTSAAGTYTDNCNTATNPVVSNNIPGSMPDDAGAGIFVKGINTVTYRVTDGSTTPATCQFTVTVNDNTPPTFTVPADVTTDCQESLVPSVNTNLGSPTMISDNCTALPNLVVAYTDVDVTPAGFCPQEHVYERTWRVTDQDNNVTVAATVQTITVEDNDNPTFSSTFYPTVIGLSYPGPGTACTVNQTLSVTAADVSDNCAAFANLTFTWAVDFATINGVNDLTTVGTSINASFPIGLSKVTLIATDPCGNSTPVKNIFVRVVDAAVPVINEPFANTLPFNNTTNVCGRTFNILNSTGNCGNTFSWYRPWASSGDFSDCGAITVTEVADNPTVQSSINSYAAYNYNTLTPFDVRPTIFFPVGETTIRYTAQDALGNSAVCSFVVDVQDIQTPVLNCPVTQTLGTICPTDLIPDYRTLVSVTDNCPTTVNLTQSPAPGAMLSSVSGLTLVSGQTFAVTVTGMDHDNTTTCTFNVRLNDAQAPIPTAASLPNIVSRCGTYTVIAPTANDVCNSVNPIIYGTPSTPIGSFSPTPTPRYTLNPGNYVITWIYNDGNGNLSSQPQNVSIVADVFPPVAICQSNITVNLAIVTTTTGMPPVTTTTASSTLTSALVDNGSNDPDACGILSLAVTPSTFGCNNTQGTNVVTLTVTDLAGNTATCTSRVTVKDVTPPVLSAVPPALAITCNTPVPAAGNVTATDICSTPTVAMVETSTQTASGCSKYDYTITRVWTASDAAGNTVSGQQVITVRDIQKPVFAANTPTSVVVFTDGTRVTCDDTLTLNIAPFVTDCASSADINITNSLLPALGANITGIYSVGTNNVVTFTATDVCGNFQTKTVTIQVLDGTAPVAACINGISVTISSSGVIALPASVFNAGSFDNCGAVTIEVRRDVQSSVYGNSVGFTCLDADGATHHPVLLRAKDVAGNTAVCATYVIVQDNVAPILTCPANRNINCTESTAVTAQGNATVTDNCSSNLVVAFSDVTAAGTGSVCSAITRTFRVTDNAGNTASCRQTINVSDTQAPVFSSMPANVTISCSDLPYATPTITATDNCSTGLIVTATEVKTNPAPGACGNYDYILRRTWSSTDACGNVMTHTQNITVKDNTPPVFNNVPANITINSASAAASTNCKVPVTLDLTQSVTDCELPNHITITNNSGVGTGGANASGEYTVGINNIRFTATDACGNTTSKLIVLTVVDNSIPTMICQDNIVVALGSQGTAVLAVNTVDLGSYDNCSITNRVLSPNTFDCGDLGSNVVALTATDNNGNTNSCVINVEVTQGTASVFAMTTTGSTTSYYGAANGTASTAVTGGTGNFTYNWSTGATTSSIAGLTAGSYTVTVTDNGSQCRRVVTIVVAQGPQLTIISGTAAGAQGTMVEIPVTVQQFNQVQSMQYSIHVNNALVATVLGITSLNPALGTLQSNISGNNIGILWADTTALGVTLPNNTVIFNIKVNLIGAANTTSPVSLDGSPVELEFIQNLSGVSTIVPVVLTNGSVSVNNGAITVKLGGDIQTWSSPTKPVANVSVNLSGSVSATQLTLVDGKYSFTVNSGSNTTVGCSKVTAGNDKITSGDLLGIVNHIFGTVPFASPYQWVAADVNFSNSVTLADYLKIQKLVLGSVQHIEGIGASDWRFVPKSYTFPTPPLSAGVPGSISHTPILTDFSDDDIVAVRYGDINGNTPVTLTNDESNSRNGTGTLNFRLDEKSFRKGELVTVNVKASEFKNRQAYQMTMAFDPTVLALEDIQMGVLPNLSLDNFGTNHLSEGYLTTVWVNKDKVSLESDEVLYTLTFRALKAASTLSEVFSAGSQITEAEAIDEVGNTQNVDFEYILPTSGGNVESRAFNLYQNQPNPFRGETIIGFRLPEQSNANFRVFNASGQLVKSIDRVFEKGYNEVRFKSTELGSTGVYWYELETPTHSDRKKMIIVE